MTLAARMSAHRTNNKKPGLSCTSATILAFEDARIELIENYPCSNRQQLVRREGEIIKSRECVNLLIAGRTGKEHYEENKERIAQQRKGFRDTHKELITERSKANYQATKDELKKKYEDNKIEVLQKRKEHYQANKEAIAAKNKAYYEAHKDEINARRRLS